MSKAVEITHYQGGSTSIRNLDDTPMLDLEPWEYALGYLPPRYPMPSVIGVVIYWDNSIIIQDCDEPSDPRRCYALDAITGELITDAPEDGIESPNRR